MRGAAFFLFFLFFLSFFYLLHRVIYKQIVSGFALSSRGRLLLFLFFLLSATLYPLTTFLARWFELYPLHYWGALWIGIIGAAFPLFLLARLVSSLRPSLLRGATATALGATLLLVCWGLWNASGAPRLTGLTLSIRDLPPQAEGLKILQLSDVHLGSMTRESWLKRLVKRVESRKPDLVVITGDLVDGDICSVTGFCGILRTLRPPLGVIAVPGNHEYYANYGYFREVGDKAGVKILVNEKIDLIKGGLQIVGLDDTEGRRTPSGGPDPVKAYKTVDPRRPVLLLSHRPKPLPSAYRVDLQLAGHTHGGQTFPMNLLVPLAFKQWKGLYRSGSGWLYTSMGTGFWGPPLRIFSQSEVVEIVLRRAKEGRGTLYEELLDWNAPSLSSPSR